MSGKMETKTVAVLGILTSVALVLGFVEHLIPITAIPGVKLGLSNTVLLYALYLLDAKSAVALMVLKVGLSGVLFGGPAAMMYSFAGGVLSLGAMLLIRKVPSVSVIGVSVCGALCHNIGQMAVACFVVESRAILAYLPVLLVSAAITGVLTGVIAKYAIKGLRAAGASRDTSPKPRKD